MIAADDAPLTSRSPGRQMDERPGHFLREAEAHEVPMQDLSEPASAGKAAPPSSGGHTNTLIRVQRRMRTVPARELPIVLRGVLLAVAGRADELAHAFPNVETIAAEAGTTPNTARRALDELIRLGWLGVLRPATARTSAIYLVRSDPVPPAPEAVPARYPRGDGAAPQGRSSGTPGVKLRVSGGSPRHPRGEAPFVRGDGAAPEDHREDPIADHREDPKPQIAHARGGDRVKGQEQLLLVPPVTSFPPAPPPAEALRSQSPKGPPRRAPPVVEIPIDELTPAERTIAEAITRDESFARTVPMPNRLARELLRIAPDVDIPRKIASLGAWTREKPANWRPRGHVFLRTCIEKAQTDAPPRPPAPPPEPPRPAPIPPRREPLPPVPRDEHGNMVPWFKRPKRPREPDPNDPPETDEERAEREELNRRRAERVARERAEEAAVEAAAARAL